MFLEFNDLWKYAPSTGQWTWVSGDSTSNQPGKRHEWTFVI